MRLFAVCILLGCAFSTTSLQAQKQKKAPKPETLFTVNKKPVTAEEFIYLYNKNHQNKTEDFTTAKVDEYLTLFINFKLKVEEARKRGMDTTASFIREYNQYKDELRRPYLPDTKITDSLTRLTYDRLKEEVKASHILLNIKADATPADTVAVYNRLLDIRAKIMAGEDFGKAAMQYSEDPSARMNQGNLGYFTALQMVYPFENAAYTTKPGQVSMPVRTRFGYHLVYVADRRPTQGEVEVSHIMLRTGEGKDNDKVKNQIFDLYDQLQAGVKWDDLCKQYSEDPGSKDNGGKLRPFGPGAMASIPDFERTAFALKNPGDVSDPFMTAYGWHIVRLERKIPLGTFEAVSPSLKGRVNRDERTQLSKLAMEAKWRRDYQFHEDAVVKARVLALGDTSLARAKWKAPVVANASRDVLFSLTGKGYTVQEFLQYAQKMQRPNTQDPAKYLEQLYNHFVDASILSLLEAKIARENPEYGYLLKEYYEGILLFEIMEKEVWNKASTDSVGQRRFFEAHAANYKAGERARATFFSASTPGFEATLQPLLLDGKADAHHLQQVAGENKVKSETGIFSKEDKPVLAKVTWAPGVYRAENNGLYYLVQLSEIIPPGPMSFEEARPTVISDYQGDLEKRWIEDLKKKYPVKVNGKGKQHTLQKLQAK
jgi:peptidyl-prolyl cis-trans isomerase SurA